MQTVQSWLGEANQSFVDAKLADHVLVWAQTTVRTAVRKNLEEPNEHFQSYGEGLTGDCSKNLFIIIVLLCSSQ